MIIHGNTNGNTIAIALMIMTLMKMGFIILAVKVNDTGQYNVIFCCNDNVS